MFSKVTWIVETSLNELYVGKVNTYDYKIVVDEITLDIFCDDDHEALLTLFLI